MLHSNATVVAALTVMLPAATPFVLHQQQSIAQEQQQQPQANLTSVEQRQLIEGISFEIDNVTFSHKAVIPAISYIAHIA